MSIIKNLVGKEKSKMEKYIRAEMEVVEFECEDVITTSSMCSDVSGTGDDFIIQ